MWEEPIRTAICIPERKITQLMSPVAVQLLICSYKSLFSWAAGSFIMAAI